LGRFIFLCDYIKKAPEFPLMLPMQAIRDDLRTEILFKSVEEMAFEFMIWFGNWIA
jgi:hypothetical protein